MNKLQKILIAETGNENIARDTGRSLMVSQSIIAFYVLSFSNLGNVIRQIAKIYNKLSRAATIDIINLGSNLCELVAIVAPGVKEEPYQCKNRIGSFEGILKLFLDQFPIIEHPECYHQGAKHCKYIISWDKPSGIFKWLRIRNYLIITGVTISLSILLFFPLNYFLFSSLILVSLITVLSHHVQKLEKEKLSQDIEELGKTAEEYWSELNVRYNVTKLVQEVGEITSVIQNEKEIASAVSKAMNSHLDYNRGAILLAKSDNKVLFFTGWYGFTDDEIEIIENAQLRLDNPVKEDVFQKVFVKQEPALIEDINKIDHLLDTENLNIFKKLKTLSMICVPIVHEGESFGVMAVDSLKSHREFREGDINLLMAVASQTAISIAHARAFRKLLESEKKHRTLVETVRDIVYTIDMEGIFSYVSPVVEVITGFKDKELLGRHFIEIVDPSYKETVMQRFAAGLESVGTSTYEIKILTKDDRQVPIELNVTALTDNTGQPIGRIGVARDITRRYEEEAKRQEMAMRALAQDKLASLGEIATGVAHEINQPLSYIKIILQSTLQDLLKEKLDTEELTEDFQESLRQIGKISNIISHLRTFGRSDVTSFGPVSLSAVLNDTLILMKERLRINNISMDINISDSFPMLHGNHIKLEQVFLNLIQNSMDALKEQGKGEITMSAESKNGYAWINFSDTGEGIDAELQEKIFEPFFTTKEAGKGTGIGLSIVHGIILEHQGTISFASEGKNGATFKIKLPIYKDENANFLTEPLNA
jgi:PAS domain S-box-containing protein